MEIILGVQVLRMKFSHVPFIRKILEYVLQQNKESKPTRGKTMDLEVEAATYERSKGRNLEKGKANSRMTVIMRPREKPHNTGIEKQGA